MDKDIAARLGLPPRGPFMAALVGAGGKTTALMALAQAYKAAGQRVLVTTTTRIYLPPPGFADVLCLEPVSPESLRDAASGSITVVGEAVGEERKVVGVQASWLDAVYRARIFDVILVEADGSRGKPVKAPAEYEPVIPLETTHVVGVIGMDALGRPADDQCVHRLEAFLAVTGAQKGQTIDEALLKRLIESAWGLYKGTPPSATRHLLLNKCTTTELAKAAESILASLDKGMVCRGTWQ